MNLSSLREIPSPTAAEGFLVDSEVDHIADAENDGEREKEREKSSDETGHELPNNDDSNDTGQNHEDKLCGSRHFYFNSLVRFVAYFVD